MKWSYGVTTVLERRDHELQNTLVSLAAAGFPCPRVFVDDPRLGCASRWALSLYELYLREPQAELYAMFQDDILVCRNVRQYVERTAPKDGYINLYTDRSNETVLDRPGWQPSLQRGRGALALVFPKDTMVDLLQAKHLVMKPQAASRPNTNVDGAVIESMLAANRKEYVHMPSLVQHMGQRSTLGMKPFTNSGSFPGETVNALGYEAESGP